MESIPSSSSCILLFSPTSSSVLGHFGDTHRLWHLDGSYVATATRGRLLAFLSRSGTYMATAHRGEHIITTTDLLSQLPPHLINTDMGVELAFTGTVLLAMGFSAITTWRLTEEGEAYGVFPKRRGDHGSSAYPVPLRPQESFKCVPKLFVEGQTGVIEYPRHVLWQTYDTRTGEVGEPVEARPCSETHFSSPILQQPFWKGSGSGVLERSASSGCLLRGRRLGKTGLSQYHGNEVPISTGWTYHHQTQRDSTFCESDGLEA